MDAGERTFPITVEETVLLGGAALSSRRPWFDRAERRRAHGILERLGIAAFAAARLDELSGGQFQRVLIGRALMSQPNLLVLDEPTSGIDLKTRSQVLQLVDELRADGYTVILTTHDLNWVAAHLPRIICLNRTVVADGSPLQVLTGAVVRQTYGAAMDVLVHNGRPVVVDAVEGSAP
jgi:ABC-type Mn2+/Zn2+ transport system ATPase subunit